LWVNSGQQCLVKIAELTISQYVKVILIMIKKKQLETTEFLKKRTSIGAFYQHPDELKQYPL
jgi:hypothetical protein